MPRVVYEEDFRNALSREITYLRERQEFGWIETLQQDLDELAGLLGRFPESGSELARQGSDVMRRLRLRRAPFHAWYSFDPADPDAPVWFLRLFHSRQNTPEPRLP